MSRTALLGTIVFVVTGLSGCASPARVVESDRMKVVVAVPDNTNTWPFYYRDEATRVASEIIQDPVLVSTTRMKVGEQMTNTQDTTRRDLGNKDKPKFGEVVTSTNTTSVSDKFEYHLLFQSSAPTQFTPPSRPGTPPPPIPNGPPLPQAGGIAPTGGIAPAGGIAPTGGMPPTGAPLGTEASGIKPPPTGFAPATNLPPTTIGGPPQ